MSRSRSTVPMKDINQFLVCSLCGGYYIDATTIMECLHSFCKTCIVRYLETSNYCPKCDVQVHKTRPLLNIRPDLTLQDLVYKLVPGLLTSEVKKRRDFYHFRPPVGESEDRQTAHERKLMAEEDKISIALEFSPDGKPPAKRRRGKVRKDDDLKPQNDLDCRYLLCPSDFTIAHIKKFIRMKFGLASDLVIDVFHDYDPLGDRYTLLDLAYMYLWRKRSPFKLFYSVYVTGDRARRRKLEQTDKAEEPAEKKQAATPQTPALPPSPVPPAEAAAKSATPSSSSSSSVQPPTQPAPSATPDVKQPANKAPAPTAPTVSTPSVSTPSSSAPTPVLMSTAPRTVINKSPLQMKIVAPTERATSVKTQTSSTPKPLTTAKTPSANGKPQAVSRQSSQDSGQGRPGQAMILPVRLPLSAMLADSSTTAPVATINNNNNNNNKIIVPKSPITAQHQLPKQVTRETELKAAHKAHAHKPLATKVHSAVPPSPAPKSPQGLNGQKLPNDYKSSPKSPSNGQKSPSNEQKSTSNGQKASSNGPKASSNGQKSPSNGQKSPNSPRPADGIQGLKNYADNKTPSIKTGQTSPTKTEQGGRPLPSPTGGSSGTLKTVLPVPHSSPSSSKGGHGGSKATEQPRAEPKVPPLRIPISRTDLSRSDLSIHHAPIRRPILQHILPKKPKKKESNKSKVDLLQARFGRNTNGQTLFMSKVHQTTHRAAPHASASASTSSAGSSSAGASSSRVVPRPPHLLMPKPAHMNEKPMQLTPPPGYHNTNHAHNSTPPALVSPAAATTGSQASPAATGSHSPVGEEQDAPLDLQTPKIVKVS